MNVLENVSMAGWTTLGVGGPARFVVRARRDADVQRAVDFARDRQLPLFVLGGGSNLLVADSGFPGVVLRIELAGLRTLDGATAPHEVLVEAAAGEEWDRVVAFAVERDLGGVECLSGIPGTAGGTPVQNVGAYGQEVSTTIRRVDAYDRESGRIVALAPADLRFAYRTSILNTTERERWIVLRVVHALQRGVAPCTAYRDVAQVFAGRSTPPSLAEVREAVRAIRRGKAMLIVPGDPDCRSAGSFFKNPIVEVQVADDIAARIPDLPRYAAGEGRAKLPAARLIEAAGFARGYRRGGAGISSRHTLALVNREDATAADILALAREIRDRVRERFGVTLVPEPVFLGFDAPF